MPPPAIVVTGVGVVVVVGYVEYVVIVSSIESGNGNRTIGRACGGLLVNFGSDILKSQFSCIHPIVSARRIWGSLGRGRRRVLSLSLWRSVIIAGVSFGSQFVVNIIVWVDVECCKGLVEFIVICGSSDIDGIVVGSRLQVTAGGSGCVDEGHGFGRHGLQSWQELVEGRIFGCEYLHWIWFVWVLFSKVG